MSKPTDIQGSDKIVRIEWFDSCGATSGVWSSEDFVRDQEPTICVSVGFVIRDEKEFITIAAHVADEEIGGYMCIPRSAIKSTEPLTRRSRRKG